MKTMNKLAAVAFTLCAATSAHAGKGGSNQAIVDAVNSGSQDAILAEVERSEGLICEDCIQTVTNLTEDSRYPVREVAAWWFGKRPGLQRLLAAQFESDLASGDSIRVRNAADFLGTTKEYKALPQLRTAMTTSGGLTSEAKIALVRAAGVMAHTSGNAILIAGMSDADPTVRVAAVDAWRDVLHQTSVTPIEGLLGDADPSVRAHAATVLGAYADTSVDRDARAARRQRHRSALAAKRRVGARQERLAVVVPGVDDRVAGQVGPRQGRGESRARFAEVEHDSSVIPKRDRSHRAASLRTRRSFSFLR